MLTVLQKIVFSVLLSVFLFLGVLFFAFNGGIADEPMEILALVAVFLTLFLIIFFCFNLRQDATVEAQAITDYVLEIEHEELEELEAVEDMPEPRTIPPSNVRLSFGDDDIPYLVESSGLELVDGDLDEIVHFMKNAESEELTKLEELETVSEEPAELEDITAVSGNVFTIFKQPFTFFPDNPELLQEAAGQVIYEQDGIHYINGNLDGDSAGKELDRDFAELVASVVKKN
jgi:hypothetical protein